MNAQAVKEILDGFLSSSPLNRVPGPNGEFRMFCETLVAVADADDALFPELKKEAAVGPQFRLPREWLPEARSVIAVFFQASEAVRRSNYGDGDPSFEWLRARIEGGDGLIPECMRMLAGELGKSGIAAVSPSLSGEFKSGGFTSNWSERHVAFVAGLGTFGLSKSLITARGSAGRFASVVIDASWPATARGYSGLYEYCSRCGACIARCPAGAIDVNGKNHQPCSLWVKEMKVKYAPRYGCGKCQTGVPCETGIPAKAP